jgi:hypothetical protein
MWNAKEKVILEIVGSSGTISKLFRQYLRNTPAMREIKELQKHENIGHCTNFGLC